MLNTITAAIMFFTMAFVISRASAQDIWSVDTTTQRLVRVNVLTGQVAVLGPLTGSGGSIVELEFLGNRLFGIAYENGGNRRFLVELNPVTGSAVTSVVIQRAGLPLGPV